MGKLTHTVQNTVSSFRSANKLPIDSLKTYFVPRKDKVNRNQANFSGWSAYATTYGLTPSVDITTETVTLTGTYSNSGASPSFRIINMPNIETTQTLLKAFELTEGNHVKALRWDGNNKVLIVDLIEMVNGETYSIQFKAYAYTGYTTPTVWEPYSAEADIRGHSRINIYHTGKNLLDETHFKTHSNWSAFISTGGDSSGYTTDGNRGYVLPVKAGVTYTISFDFSQEFPTYLYLCKTTGNCAKRIAYFTTGASNAITNHYYTFTPIEGEVWYTRIGNSNTTANFNTQMSKIHSPMLEVGNTKTEYEAYHGSVYPFAFPALGKNLWDLTTWSGGSYNPSVGTVFKLRKAASSHQFVDNHDGTFTVKFGSVTWDNTCLLFHREPGVTYHRYINIKQSGNRRISWITLDENFTVLSVTNNTTSADIVSDTNLTATTEGRWMCLLISSGSSSGISVTIENPQIEVGSSKTSYESYVPFYGGYFDAISGELASTYNHITIDPSQVLKYEDSDGMFWYTTAGQLNIPAIKSGSEGSVVASRFKNGAVSTASKGQNIIWYSNGIIRWKEQTSMTLTEYREFLIDHPVIVYYEVAAPQTYQISPIECSSFLDRNHIWNDANGGTEVEYEIVDYMSKRRVALNEPHLETLTDHDVWFNTDMKTNLASCIIDFKPAQTCNGYDKAWLGGHGDNILLPYTENLSSTSYGVTMAWDANKETMLISGTNTDTAAHIIWQGLDSTGKIICPEFAVGETYSFTAVLPTGCYANLVYSNTNGTAKNLTNITGDGTFKTYAFTIPSDYVSFVRLQVGILAEVEVGTVSVPSYFMVKKGSVLPTRWSPYKNISPISGWTGIATAYSGESTHLIPVNFQPETNIGITTRYLGGSTFSADGAVHGNGKFFDIPIEPVTAPWRKDYKYFTIMKSPSSVISTSGVYTRMAESNGTGWFSVRSYPQNYTNNVLSAQQNFTQNENWVIELFRYGIILEDKDVQVTFFISKDAPTITPINWSSSGTLYGGYVDLIKGVVVKTFAYKQMTYSWINGLGSGYIGYESLHGVWVRNWNYSEAAPRKAHGIKAYCNAYDISMHNTSIFASQYRIYFQNASSVESFKSEVQALESSGTNLYIAYELATPVTYQLSSPIQFKTLVGENNIWTNSNSDITIKYWKH